MTVYRWLADLVVVAHVLFVVFAVLGGVLVFRRPWVAWLHLPAAAWAVLIQYFGWTCPLTPLENALRARAGGATYNDGFIAHYLLRALYPAGLTREIQLALGALALVTNIVIYTFVLRQRRLRRRRETSGSDFGV